MKPLLSRIVGLLLLAGAQAQTQPASPGGDQTVITSDTLDLNLGKAKGQKQGVFRGNVKVDEPRFSMTAKEMTVFFGDDDSVQQVEARENVEIERKDGSSKTKSEKALYDVREKKLTLLKGLKQPEVQTKDGKRVIADKIILFPEEDKMLTEGASRVMLQKP